MSLCPSPNQLMIARGNDRHLRMTALILFANEGDGMILGHKGA
jgi:hypothetical protein